MLGLFAVAVAHMGHQGNGPLILEKMLHPEPPCSKEAPSMTVLHGVSQGDSRCSLIKVGKCEEFYRIKGKYGFKGKKVVLDPPPYASL